MSAMSARECGCEAVTHAAAPGVHVVAHCPLHAAAPDMFRILSEIYAAKSHGTQEMRRTADRNDDTARALLATIEGSTSPCPRCGATDTPDETCPTCDARVGRS